MNFKERYWDNMKLSTVENCHIHLYFNVDFGELNQNRL